MYIAICTVFLLFAALFIPVRIIAERKEDFDFYIKILFFKLRPGHSKKKKTKKIGNSNRKKKKNVLSLIKRIMHIFDDIKDVAEFFAKKCLTIENITVSLHYGTGDAATTGVSAGALNALVYTILGVVHRHTTLQKWSVDLQPDFEREKFEFSFLCIGRVRLLHIIGMAVKGLKLYKKFKKQ